MNHEISKQERAKAIQLIYVELYGKVSNDIMDEIVQLWSSTEWRRTNPVTNLIIEAKCQTFHFEKQINETIMLFNNHNIHFNKI